MNKKKNKGKGSCYVGNERKYPSMNSYGGKLVREKHDGQFRNIKKKKIFSHLCVAHLVAFNHFTRRHT
jgi:hypothetical protein